MLWMTGTNSLNFLIFVGIAMFLAVCPAGCYYRATFPGGGRRLNSCFLACPPKRIKVKNSEGIDVMKGKACPSGSKPSWRTNTGSFMHKISNRVGPQKLARLIFWFAQKASPKQISSRTGIHEGSASHSCLWIRAAILRYMLKLTENEMIGGGYDDTTLVVLVDETYITKKKRQRGGFQGRTTTGHKTIVLGFFELNIAEEPCFSHRDPELQEVHDRGCNPKVRARGLSGVD